ncbi:MAG: DMT family transporter [Gammaproteobacteria bacterium]|nr:DMT family transporter [Gammaproteobacteria bacterium]
MRYQQNIFLGALFILLSELMFASVGALVKQASNTLPNESLVFMRNFMGLLFIVPVLLHGRLKNLHTRVPQLHLLRAVFGVSAMYCYFYALAHLPLADAVLLKTTSPIFIPLIAWLWLGEKNSMIALLAVPIGFVGVGLILDPAGETGWITLVGVLGGLLAAAAKVTVRRLARTESTASTVFYFAVFGTLVSFIPMSLVWTMPALHEWYYLVGIGLFASIGQLFLTRGYAIAPVAKVGPFTYFSVVFAAFYGYVFWGETLDLYFVLGAALIIIAGVLAIGLWRRRPQDYQRAEQEVSGP